jgi:hypothetical protein
MPYEQSRSCSLRVQQCTISEAVVNNAEEMAAAVVAHYPLANRAFERLLDILPAMTNYAAIPLRNYVSRPSVEDGILQAYNSCFGRDDGVYTVVVGPEGSGKTSTTACMSEHKTGVLHLSMNREDTPSSVLRKILSISGEQLDYKTFQPGLRDLYPLLVLVASKMGGRRLTILLDVDSYVCRYADSLAMVRVVAAQLAQAANVVVVTSDQTASVAFAHPDPNSDPNPNPNPSICRWAPSPSTSATPTNSSFPLPPLVSLT